MNSKQSSEVNLNGIVYTHADERVKDLYLGQGSNPSEHQWHGRYSQVNPSSVPERKDSCFFVKTDNAVLYSQLSGWARLRKLRDVSAVGCLCVDDFLIFKLVLGRGYQRVERSTK